MDDAPSDEEDDEELQVCVKTRIKYCYSYCVQTMVVAAYQAYKAPEYFELLTVQFQFEVQFLT